MPVGLNVTGHFRGCLAVLSGCRALSLIEAASVSMVVVVLPLLRSLRPEGILLSDWGFSCKTSGVLGRKIVLVSLGICARRVALGLLLPLWVVCQAQMPFL